MPVDWIDALTRFVLPPILGGAGGLIGVYANWGIEQRRQRLARRRELVTGWRMNLVPLITRQSPNAEIEEVRAALFASPFYASLRPHLSVKLRRRLEGENRTIIVGENFPLEPILDEIGQIERRWQLV
jgi:hypothetical protein